ncbi:hypothetical protein cypCar_00019665 [Cyprinus carpio]|nr:hypothetical protein cypCar_00019665 [Cyprinus carpio]
MNYFTQDSSAFDKEEIVKSVYLCPPGPHAFLLVVRVDRTFTEIYRRAIEEHIELISKEVWDHSIVLFSFGDWLGDTTIEQYIESEGKALQRLVERCGNRYHVLNNKRLGNKFQITELLEKIEKMTAGSHFKTDESLFKEMKRKQQIEEDSAKIRRENVLRRKQSLRAFKKNMQNLIDQWGDSNIEELEAFIDSYFEMVWQEAMNEPKCTSMTPINSEGITENDQGHLASIDRKLSKLDILEGVQRDLQELKQTIKHCSRIFQELKDSSKETHDPSRTSEATASAESEETGQSDEK